MTRRGPRPITRTDLNADIRPEIIRMLIHNNGITPDDKATVCSMTNPGEGLLHNHWATRISK